MIHKDITVDFNVLNYLKNKILPDDPIERNRVKRRGINYVLDDERVFYGELSSNLSANTILILLSHDWNYLLLHLQCVARYVRT